MFLTTKNELFCNMPVLFQSLLELKILKVKKIFLRDNSTKDSSLLYEFHISGYRCLVGCISMKYNSTCVILYINRIINNAKFGNL